MVNLARLTTLSLACPTWGQVDDLSHDLQHKLRPQVAAGLQKDRDRGTTGLGPIGRFGLKANLFVNSYFY
jgi:hypothetical protein